MNRYPEHEYHEITPQISHAVQEIHPIDTNNYGADAIGISGNVGGTNNQQSFSNNHSYDILPPGVDREPPPPGFENEVSHFDKHSIGLSLIFYRSHLVLMRYDTQSTMTFWNNIFFCPNFYIWIEGATYTKRITTTTARQSFTISSAWTRSRTTDIADWTIWTKAS